MRHQVSFHYQTMRTHVYYIYSKIEKVFLLKIALI